jgi:hypothetical protein
MSKLTRALAIGATLAAVTLAGVTTVAHAQATDEPARHDARRPPTQGQVGEAWHHHQVTLPEQAAADTAHRRQTAQEQSYESRTTPAQPTVPAPTQPNRQPRWLLASFGVLAVLMLVAALSVLGVRRASRRVPPPAASPTR